MLFRFFIGHVRLVSRRVSLHFHCYITICNIFFFFFIIIRLHWLLLLYLYCSYRGNRIGNRIRIHIRTRIRIRLCICFSVCLCALSSASYSLVSYQHICFSCASFASLLLMSLEGISRSSVHWLCI